jgi:hypothetical protein
MPRGALHDPAVSNQPRSRPINAYDMRYGIRGAHQEAVDTSSACGAARQKPGCIIVRHFCDWIVCCNAYKPRNTLNGASHDPAVSNQLRPMSNRQIRDAHGTGGADTPSTCGTTRQGAARQKSGRVICEALLRLDCVLQRVQAEQYRMILLSQISSDQCPIDKYEMRTA